LSEDKEYEDKLFQDYQRLFSKQIDSGHDPVSCAIIMISLGLGVCRNMMSKEEYLHTLEWMSEMSDEVAEQADEVTIPKNVTFH
jgi:hypothetical protein